jgi:hypothetical protein
MQLHKKSPVFGKAGDPTLFLLGAEIVISDYRIPPLGYKPGKYSFPFNKRIVPPFTIKAVLQYKSAPQSLVNSLLGKNAPTLPVLDMAEAEASLP